MLAKLQKTTIDNTVGAANAIQPHPSKIPDQDAVAFVESITKILEKRAEAGVTSESIKYLVCRHAQGQQGELFYSANWGQPSCKCPPVVENWRKEVNKVTGDIYRSSGSGEAMKLAVDRLILFVHDLMQDLVTLWQERSDVRVAINTRVDTSSTAWYLTFDWSGQDEPYEVRLAREQWERRKEKTRAAYDHYQNVQQAAESPLKKAKN